MKVTFIAREYPPYVYGGAGVHLRHLAQNLARFIDVEVRCFGDQNIKEKNLRIIGYKPSEEIKSREKKFQPMFDTFTTDLRLLADGIDSDIVHTHTWYGHFAGFLAKKLYNIPFVATSHSLEPLRPWKVDQLGNAYEISTWIEKIALENADKLVAVSKMMKKDLLKYFNVKEENIVVIHNGIDLNKWQHTPISNALKKQYEIKDDYILFVGRPTPQKGMEYLIDAADFIDQSVQIVFAAVGSDTKDYEDRMTEKVQTKKNILWIHKLLKEEEYVQLYSSAKVFVCPSIYEPFGIINLEAMATQTPVVATKVGGILEVVGHNETGLLVEPANPKQIADAVNELLKNENKRKTFGLAGRKRVEQYFSWEKIAIQTKELYESLI